MLAVTNRRTVGRSIVSPSGCPPRRRRALSRHRPWHVACCLGLRFMCRQLQAKESFDVTSSFTRSSRGPGAGRVVHVRPAARVAGHHLVRRGARGRPQPAGVWVTERGSDRLFLVLYADGRYRMARARAAARAPLAVQWDWDILHRHRLGDAGGPAGRLRAPAGRGVPLPVRGPVPAPGGRATELHLWPPARAPDGDGGDAPRGGPRLFRGRSLRPRAPLRVPSGRRPSR